MPLDLIISALKGVGLLKDPQQEEKARQAVRDAYAQFLTATSNPIFSVARTIVIFLSGWDIFFNQARAGSAALQNLATLPYGWIELIPIAWLFLGPEIVQGASAALGQAFVQQRAAVKPQPTPSGSSVTSPESGRGKDI